MKDDDGPERASRVVRVTIPSEIEYDLKQFQKAQENLLGRLGCQACCSGFDIRYETERRFVVDNKTDVRTTEPGR